MSFFEITNGGVGTLCCNIFGGGGCSTFIWEFRFEIILCTFIFCNFSRKIDEITLFRLSKFGMGMTHFSMMEIGGQQVSWVVSRWCLATPKG